MKNTELCIRIFKETIMDECYLENTKIIYNKMIKILTKEINKASDSYYYKLTNDEKIFKISKKYLNKNTKIKRYDCFKEKFSALANESWEISENIKIKRGRTRIPNSISSTLLACIIFFEKRNWDLIWLIEFLEDGELSTFLYNNFGDSVHVPLTSFRPRLRNWLTILKETLHRNLFSDEKYISKKITPEFSLKKKKFYSTYKSRLPKKIKKLISKKSSL
jgi:hypothetical protein